MSPSPKSENSRTLAYYCERFSELNVSRDSKRGTAHYKPILLLCVIDLISQNIIQENKIFVSDELIETFNKYWNIIASEYKGGFHYPFFHLQSEGFWHLRLQPDFNGLQPKTMNKLKQAVEYASLDNELFELLQEESARKELIDTLISVWFSSSQKKVEDILQINQGLEDYTRKQYLEINKGELIDKKQKVYLEKSLVRNAFFRKAIVHIYEYKCAFCRLKVTRKIKQNIVDGAHIKTFAKFYDSSINNGIAFCKNHHWAFDIGWFGIDESYQIIVSEDLEEESPNAKLMKDFHGETILLPNLEIYYPSPEALNWHLNNVFRL
ncbi:MAG: HNH endonuclease [Oscillatoria sp. PMC 1051.18]|nr:HNH endonuclease [Oscillatoria sp. PMC 1050.18]MEC5031499.1 HNH endonuclease [Oscillatoria sp. PMC 1051.18]